jgi:hypothetical protein
MDGEAFQEWVHCAVQPYKEVHNNSLYLLLDQFSVHIQHNNIFALQQIVIEVDFIPVGYSAILQVLDKGVHKPFEQYLRKAFHPWSTIQREPSILNSTSKSGLQGHGIKCNTLPFSTPGSPLASIHSIIIS